ncbi:MAG TPA: glycosyltransferase family 2 protein [Planctomycetaceae bacterium]|jgi:glycosyltransferase involved in cell wall biosynthesis|nr:glycosyltransferase family 2 protein [Planctomycetaceae bacterium]
MRTVAVTCIKNERDIIEPLVRHTCRLVDRMIVMDDGSHDDSPVILRQLVKEGLPLEVIQQRSIGRAQHAQMTRLICTEAGHRLQAEWIVALDADEFLCLPPGTPLIGAGQRRDACLLVPWRGYVTTPGDDVNARNPVVRIQHRRACEPQPVFKVIVPGNLARQPNAHVEQGNHLFWIGDDKAPHAHHQHAWLAHFPIRSPAQYLKRVVGTQLAYLTMSNRHLNWGWSCREPFETLKSRPDVFETALHAYSRWYGISPEITTTTPEIVSDPVPYLGSPLRFTAGPESLLQAFAIIVRLAEDLAMRHGVLARTGDDQTRLKEDQDLQILKNMQMALRDRERRSRELEEALECVFASWTWRTGRLVTTPIRVLRRALQNPAEALARLGLPARWVTNRLDQVSSNESKLA